MAQPRANQAGATALLVTFVPATEDHICSAEETRLMKYCLVALHTSHRTNSETERYLKKPTTKKGMCLIVTFFVIVVVCS